MWFRNPRREQDLADELDLHIRLDTARRVREGESAADAAASARREFGNRMLVAESVRRQWTSEWLQSLAADLRFACRNFRRNPAFASTAVLTLAVGIGASTIMFSVLYGVLIHPFPYRDANRLVLISVFDRRNPGEPGRRRPLSPNEARAYSSQTDVFEGIVSSEPRLLPLTFQGFDRPTRVIGVSADTFEFIGIPARLGRPLLPSDAAPSAPAVAAISEDAWLELYGGDPAIVGKTVFIDGKPRTIVGVIPKRYAWFQGEFWTPLETAQDPNTPARYVQGRLKPGVPIALTNRELTAAGGNLARLYPNLYPHDFEVRGVYCIDDLVGGAFRRTLYLLSGAVFLVLLIASSNVAGLLLARATSRSPEIGMRLALGAARMRIVRQLLVESCVLALAASFAGCLVAWGGLRALPALLPKGAFAPESVVDLNLPVLAFALALSLVTVFLFGLAPAGQLVRASRFDALRSGSKSLGGGGHALRLADAFLAAQIALAVVITLAAGLYLRTFTRMLHIDLAVNPNRIVVAVPMFRSGVPIDPRRIGATMEEYTRRLRRLPGVRSVGLTTLLPATKGYSESRVEAPEKRDFQTVNAFLSFDSEGIADAAGYHLLAGRWIQDADSRLDRRIAVVNASFCRASLSPNDIIGRSLRLPGVRGSMLSYEIVGVVEDVRDNGLRLPVEPMIHIPLGRGQTGWIVVRTTAGTSALIAAMPQILARLDSSLLLAFSGTLAEQLESELGPQRFASAILGIFALLGLGLMTVGLYGSVSYTVSRRTRELGLRKALGARTPDIVRSVSARAFRTAGLGAAAGIAASIFASRLIADQLGPISAGDLPAWLSVALAVCAATLIGVAVPAAKALYVDAATSLRHE